MKTNCDCQNCRHLCQIKPGWFLPGEATKAAAHLGLTLQQFFEQYLTVDYWIDGENGDTDVLSPAWDTSKFWEERAKRFGAMLRGEPVDHRGRRASWADGLISGPCRLLTPTGCKLPFEVRPHECRTAYGCRPGGSPLRPGMLAPWRQDRSELVQLKIGGR